MFATNFNDKIAGCRNGLFQQVFVIFCAVLLRRSKSKVCLLEVVLSTFTPRLTPLVLHCFLLRASSEPVFVLAVIFLFTMIFPPKVSSSPLAPALRSSLSRLSSILTTYFSKQTFFPHILQDPKLSLGRKLLYKMFHDPLFSTFPQHYEMLPLNANTD